MRVIKKLLKNGLRLLFLPIENTQTVTILILIRTGSKHEKKEINGISHFLEHMCFKGTKNRPTPLMVLEPLDQMGALYNAFTSQDYTGYWIKVDTSHFSPALEIVADIFLNPLLDEKEVEKEKSVIQEEINMIFDNPQEYVENLWLKVLYQDQSAGWPITGTKETIKNINREKLLFYRRRNYNSLNTVICVAGRFPLKKAEEELKRYFSGLAKGKKQGLVSIREEQKKPSFLIEKRKTDQSHLIIGFRAFNLFDPRKYCLQLLAKILGGMMSSRLFSKIRIEKGLAYYISASSSFSPENGSFEITTGLKNEALLEGIFLILQELKKIKKEGIKKEELQKAKENLISKINISLETSDSQASFYGFQELLEGRIKKKEEILQKIQLVKIEDIQRVANIIFQPTKLNLAMVGNLTERGKLEKILKTF